MASETTEQTSVAAPVTPAQTGQQPTPAVPTSLLGEPAQQQEPAAAAKTPEQLAGEAEAAKRVEAWTGATEPEARKAAYAALTPEEKAAAFKALKPEDAKALGIEDPAIPQYTEFKLPEGVAVDQDAMAAATQLFRDARLSQEQAQKFIEMAVGREQAAAKASLQAYVDLQTKWVEEVKADPEVGGDKLEASRALAARAIDRLAVPGLRDALNLTGAGNHPAIFKLFVRVGQLVSEDRFAPGRPPAQNAPKTLAQAIYGDAPKQSASA